MIGEDIRGGRILERKTVPTSLERQDGRVCKTRYRIIIDEKIKGYNRTRGHKLYKVKIFDR